MYMKLYATTENKTLSLKFPLVINGNIGKKTNKKAHKNDFDNETHVKGNVTQS